MSRYLAILLTTIVLSLTGCARSTTSSWKSPTYADQPKHILIGYALGRAFADTFLGITRSSGDFANAFSSLLNACGVTARAVPISNLNSTDPYNGALTQFPAEAILNIVWANTTTYGNNPTDGSYHLELVDIKSRKTVWQGSTNLHFGYGVDTDRVSLLIREVTSELVRNAIIPTTCASANLRY